MVLTVRILIHELEQRFGEVLVGSAKVRHRCSDVRLLDGDPSPSSNCSENYRSDFIYVVASEAARAYAAAAESGAVLLEVGQEAVSTDGRLALRSAVSCREVFSFLQDVFARYRTWLEQMELLAH